MKRSERIKKQANRTLLTSLGWFFASVFLASMGISYADQTWPLCLCALAGLMLLFSIALLCEGFNKKRLARIERQWEKRRAIKQLTQSL